MSTSGALLPQGDELDFTIPGRRWICPVRTCRTVFAKVSDLGYHFEVCPSSSWLEIREHEAVKKAD